MANHRAADALVLIASLLVVIALSWVDARPTVRPGTAMADLHSSNTSLTVHHDTHGQGYVADDAVAPALLEAEPDCDDDGNKPHHGKEKHGKKKHNHNHKNKKHKNKDKKHPSPYMPEKKPPPPFRPYPESHPAPPKPGTYSNTRLNVRRDVHGPGYVANAAAPEAEVTCDTCEDPQPEPEPCSTCEPPPEPEPCSTCEPSPAPEPEELTCNKVHGVKDGETCYSVAQCVGITLDEFLRFNPNVCCDNLFIGQWVCVDGKAPCDD